MSLLDTLIATAIAITSHSLFFLFGMLIANHYNDRAEVMKRDALEKQFLRLRAHADADDPCRPYKSSISVLPEGFEESLRNNGAATAMLNKRNRKAPDNSAAG